MDKKNFVLVVNEFWGCVGLSFEEYCWLDWFCVMFVKREMLGFQRRCCQNFVKSQDPYSCFGYRLSYNHPNEVILIDKEP